jgi:hypothetical protein
LQDGQDGSTDIRESQIHPVHPVSLPDFAHRYEGRTQRRQGAKKEEFKDVFATSRLGVRFSFMRIK